ncbi:hypothetical protein GCM10023165_37640 [Variovorax defluvii]|uniref:KfrA N-terminal DNA-binding domain-containing protein n=1 Tax=Variovorax defluvii TaxID=913761 RepID=A0ABP8I2Z3_9BURK|nr:DNA-binding protein [Brevibacterium yomogidense]
MQENQTPEVRAEQAARDLADRGMAVTARAVREAAGVRMVVAAATAKAWNAAAAEQDHEVIPDVPEDVQGRLSAIWADAYRAALAAVTPERDRLATEVEELRGEVDALTATVADVETERDERAARLDKTEQERASVVSARDDAVVRASRAEDRAEAAEAERDRVSEQMRALIARIPEIDTKREELS